MADLSPRFRECLKMFTRGNLAQAHMGSVAQAHMGAVACTNRQERNRQSFQKGVILYADGARTIVRKRVDNSAQKKLQDAHDALE